MILKAASLYCPDAMGHAIMEDMRRATREYHGYCQMCGELIRDPKADLSPGNCAKCTKEINETVDALERERPDPESN